MLNDRIHKRTKEITILIFILLLAAFLIFYPHLNYPFPLHVDEWFHITEAKMILQSNIDWYSGKQFNLGMERAWHLSLAAIQAIFNLSITQWIFVPVIMHLLAILSVYTFTTKLLGKTQALIAALLISLLPSNLTMGGPVFLVPVNLSLILIPIALTFAFHLTNLEKKYNYAALLAISIFLLYAHPPSALALLSILGIYLILNISTKEAKPLFITILLAIIISIPNYIPELQRKGIGSISFDFWITLKELPKLYGYIPTFFFILGFYLLTQTNRKETWSLLLASILFTLNIVLFVRFDINYLIPYQRTFIPLFLLMSVIASQGFVELTEIKTFKRFSTLLLIAVLFVTTYLAVDRNLKTQYYHVIDKADYESFLWIKDNTEKDVIVLIDPWKARALPTVAERQVYAVLPFGPNEQQMKIVNQVNNFFKQNCTDTEFLLQTNASLVYSTTECQNDNLIKVRDSIYSLRTISS